MPQCCLCEQEAEVVRKCIKCPDRIKQIICNPCYGSQNKCPDCFFQMERENQNYIQQHQKQITLGNKQNGRTATAG